MARRQSSGELKHAPAVPEPRTDKTATNMSPPCRQGVVRLEHRVIDKVDTSAARPDPLHRDRVEEKGVGQAQ